MTIQPRPGAATFCRRLLLCLCLFAPAAAAAQESGRIEGIVLDARTGEPLVAANVFLRDRRVGTFSDREGAFVIPGLPALSDRLIVSYLGYRQREMPVTLRADQTLRVEVKLERHTLDMGNIIVTGSRKAESEFRSQQAVTVAGEEMIANRSGGSTADALREESGVMIQKTSAGHGTPIIRGLIGKDILLLYNGVRLNKPTFRPGGNQYMETIDAEALRRIEVVRGPGSVMYGSDALGGMVNMIARPPDFSDESGWTPRVRTRFTTSDAGRSVHVGLRRTGPTFTAQMGVTARRTGDLQPGGAIPAHHPTGYEEVSGHLLTALSLGKGRTLRADILNVRQSNVPRYDQYASGRFDTWIYDPQDRLLATVAYEHEQPFSWMHNLEWNVSWQQESEGRLQRRAGSTALTFEEDHIRTLGTFLQGTTIVQGRHALQYGFEYYRDRVNSARTRTETDTSFSERGAYPNGSEFNQLGGFMSDEIVLGAASDLSIGLRYSAVWYSAPLGPPFGFYTDEFSDLTGNLGVSHRVSPGLNLIASVARGFRAPNFNDTVVLQVTNSGVDAPNPGLRAEASTNFEIGAKMEWDDSDLETFLYYSALTDLIVSRPGTYLGLPFLDENGNGFQDPTEPPVEVKQNAAEAYIAGIELQGRWHLSEALSLRANAHYTYGQNTSDDEPMRRIPPLMGLAGLTWSRGGTTWEVFVRAATAQHRLSAEDLADSRIGPDGTSGWADWNFRLGRPVGPVRLGLTLGNIFDHAYKEHGSGVYNPGRYLVISLEFAAAP